MCNYKNYKFKFSFKDDCSDTYIITNIFCDFVFWYNEVPYDMKMELELDLSQTHNVMSLAYLDLTTGHSDTSVNCVQAIGSERRIIDMAFERFVKMRVSQHSLAEAFNQDKKLLATLNKKFKQQLIFYKGL